MNQQAIEILNKVKESIRRHPEGFDMSTWECGTTACIAGWICRNAGMNVAGSLEAAEVLGVPRHEAYDLWFLDHWPNELARKYTHAECNTMKAEAACEAIDAFIQNPSRFRDPLLDCNAMRS